ncbi:MAG TPA: OmpA family protein [Phycisphaerae bacterium]|nr:OmpA family protein [Phycisphaerae bacterium]
MRPGKQKIRLIGRAALVLAIGIVAASSVGCQQQQLEERNAALQKQLEQALIQSADLQAENDGLRGQNQELQSELARTNAIPAPPPTTPAKQKPDFGEGVDVSVVGDVTTVTLPNTILFDSGQATLKSASKQVLDRIATVLNRDYAGQKIRVEGHTDNQPIQKTKKLWSDNWDLSCNRAMAVLRYLVSKGVDAKRIYAAGYSYYKPVGSNSTTSGRAKNRRVAIVVSPR